MVGGNSSGSSFWDWDSHWIGYTLRRCQKRIQSQCSPRINGGGDHFLPLLPGGLLSSLSSSSSSSSHPSHSSTLSDYNTSISTYNNCNTSTNTNTTGAGRSSRSRSRSSSSNTTTTTRSWRWPRRSKAMDPSNLPYTIFAEIISYLSPTDTIVCKRVSRSVYQALTRCDLSISLILTHFPRSLEGRLLRGYLARDDRLALGRGDWAAVFARLARRYYHLGNAMPWKVDKVPLLRDERRLRGVTPWNRFLSLNGKTAPFHYWEPMWTFSASDALLIFPAEGAENELEYRARDLSTGLEFAIPFDVREKVVRRVRLSHGVLIFEWCDDVARYPLEDGEVAYGQFATAYDVRRMGSNSCGDGDGHVDIDGGIIPQRDGGEPAPPPASWAFAFRAEWRIHLAVGYQDRFFSAHNGTHYALYFWQPTRSPWGGDPFEGITIWEIGSPSTYPPLPSQHLSGNESLEPVTVARKIRNITRTQLSHWGIRQGNAPSLRSIALDDSTWDPETNSACGHVFLTEEEHRWSAGPHSSSHPPRLHHVKTTGIPLAGEGPRWVDTCGGGEGLRFCWRGSWRRRALDVGDGDGYTDRGDWFASETWAGKAPCWRHDDFPYITVSEVFDAAAGVRIMARDCFMLETLSVHVRPKLRVQGVNSPLETPNTTSDASQSRSSSRSGTTASHDDEHASRPSREKKSLSKRTKNKNKKSSGGSRPYKGTRTEGPDGQEVQFADGLWAELMGKGFICGDERWIVGEDRNGDVTILHF